VLIESDVAAERSIPVIATLYPLGQAQHLVLLFARLLLLNKNTIPQLYIITWLAPPLEVYPYVQRLYQPQPG
jgi:hypothetical protein